MTHWKLSPCPQWQDMVVWNSNTKQDSQNKGNSKDLEHLLISMNPHLVHMNVINYYLYSLKCQKSICDCVSLKERHRAGHN